MRTTIDFQPDVQRAIEQHRRRTGKGLSETVNELLRESLVGDKETQRRVTFQPRPMGARIDVSNVAEALDVLEDS